jgi:hypothetical protein
MEYSIYTKLFVSLFALAAATSTLQAEESLTEDPAAELAKKLNNPVASLISVPFQFNWDEGYGPNDAGRFTLNVQPVVPISLNKDWNLIIRTIVPIIDMESPAPGVGDASGMGDIVQSFFLSPKNPTSSGWIWAVGPVFLWPTATDDRLGSEKWGAGATALLLKQERGWTYGALANHIWSYAGNDSREPVNATFVQPFLSYTTKKHTTIGVNSESTYDWNAGQWTIPFNFTVAQLVKIGGHPVQFTVGARYYAESPLGGPEWGLRAVVTLLFPTHKPAAPVPSK